MKEYETKDEFYEADKAFFEAHSVLLSGVGDLENASTIVTEYALKSGDHGALAFFSARFADFVDAGKPPPMPMLKGLRDVFNTFREGGCASMNDAFALSRDGKGRPKQTISILDREWARTHANLVAHFRRGGTVSLEDAVDEVVAFRAASIRRNTGAPDLSAPKASTTKIKRDYLKFRRFKK